MRRRIWQVGCPGLDSILCTSFDPDELLGLDPAFSAVYDIPDHPGIAVPHEILVYGVAHRMCHEDNAASRRIERRLDAMHARLIEEFQGLEDVEVLARCYGASSEGGGELAGCIWGVLTDPRPNVRRHGMFWIQGVTIRAMMHWLRSRRPCAAPPEGKP